MRHFFLIPVCLAGGLTLAACTEKGDETVERAFQDVNVVDETNLNDVMLTVADPNEAVDYFLRACNLGVPDGCNTAGYLMSVGEGNLERNVELGVEYMAQACRMGHEDGCSRSLGHFISASSPARNYGRAVATAADFPGLGGH